MKIISKNIPDTVFNGPPQEIFAAVNRMEKGFNTPMMRLAEFELWTRTQISSTVRIAIGTLRREIRGRNHNETF